MTYHGDEAFPALGDEQWARLQAYGSAQEVESGALLFGVGEATYDLILVDSGEAEVVRAATARVAEAVVAGFGTGQFLGELGLLTGQATYLSARVSKGVPVLIAEKTTNIADLRVSAHAHAWPPICSAC